MKKTIFSLFSIVLVAGIMSCKKEKTEDSVDSSQVNSGCKLLEVKNAINNNIISYEYDGSGRIIKIQEYNENTGEKSLYALLEYQDKKVIKTNYHSDGSASDTKTTYFLNNQGFAELQIDNYISDNDSTFYKYNAEGYLIKISHKKSYIGNSDSTIYSYSGGNKTMQISFSQVNNNTQADTSVYEYYFDHVEKTGLLGVENERYNTIFLGKKSTNLLKTIIILDNYSPHVKDEYTYEFDSNGLPTKSNLKSTYHSDQKSFTYKCH